MVMNKHDNYDPHSLVLYVYTQCTRHSGPVISVMNTVDCIGHSHSQQTDKPLVQFVLDN